MQGHAHQVSDTRQKLIKVLSVDGGKISYEDLEQHTVGLDQVFEIDPAVFRVVEVAPEARGKSEITMLSLGSMKGAVGVLAYCQGCGLALGFKRWKEDGARTKGFDWRL